ncbi:MAG: cobyrinate a,c-diamide synthase [Selenomonadaceae bacterium]|nr:cobyrinate a,c-diamide synthase [Selenomonadaceae bacterium]
MQNLPRIVIAGVSSGTGKTTVTAGVLCALKKRNFSLASFKIGPDYIDPSYHELLSGAKCNNLDSWLIGEKEVSNLFYQTAKDVDISVIEGVMGLYDGGREGVSSTAEIAKLIDAPVILVINCKSIGASAAAIATGFRDYDKDMKFAGVILNKLGSKSHENMIREAMKKANIKVFGAIKRDENLHLPERHLGLLPAEENEQKDELVKYFSEIEKQLNIDEIIAVSKNVDPVKNISFISRKSEQKNVKIAVAKDEAFSFYYEDSLSVLEEMGAEIIDFSPLYDEKLPPCDGLILGGGFPEMFAEKLEKNISMRDSIKNAAQNGLPIYAECGGYMYLMKSIADLSGKCFNMAGVIDKQAKMQYKLQTVGYVTATQIRDTIFGKKDVKFRGHEFHFSVADEEENLSAFTMEKMRTGKKYLAGYAKKNILGSYLHLHFRGEKEAAENFINSCLNYKNKKGELWEK